MVVQGTIDRGRPTPDDRTLLRPIFMVVGAKVPLISPGLEVEPLKFLARRITKRQEVVEVLVEVVSTVPCQQFLELGSAADATVLD